MQKLLPPILFLLLIAVLVPLHLLHPETGSLRDGRSLPWDIPLAIGAIVLLAGWMQFRKAGSEIVTFKTPRNLVTRGIFRFSRNPMYLGFFLMILGAALFVNTLCALVAPLLFFAAAQWWYIPFEERAAADAFGEDYLAYRRKVRRWI